MHPLIELLLFIFLFPLALMVTIFTHSSPEVYDRFRDKN